MDISITGEAAEERQRDYFPSLVMFAMIMTIYISLPKAAQHVASPHGDHLKPEARELLQAINGVGDSCGIVTRTFLRGVDRAKPTVYWSAACANGKSYQIRVTADRVRITNCGLANLSEALCFAPLTTSTTPFDETNTVFREATRPE
jgi:hypothetical protein